MSDYLLIHGAWHGAWCWDALAQDLRAAGHTVTAIDLPGLGADQTPLDTISLQTWTDRVVKALHDSPRPQILVGHSMGGMVITTALDALPEKVASVVYLCAFLPQDGESLYALATRPEGAATQIIQEATPDGLCVTVAPMVAMQGFYGCCRVGDALAAASRLQPLPVRPVLDTVSLGNPAAAAVPRHYIECTEDRAIPVALQRFMASRVPGIRVQSLKTDHSPFLSLREELAAALQNQL